MRIWERFCLDCGERFGCKYRDEYDNLVIKECRDCEFSLFEDKCIDEHNEILATHGICYKCYKIRCEKMRRR